MIIKEVYKLSELPSPPMGEKFFVCIGGSKNYQCFQESVSLSRAQFMEKYSSVVPYFLQPLYQDDKIQVRLDSTYAVPGFCIISPIDTYRDLVSLPESLYLACTRLAVRIMELLYSLPDVKSVYYYYDEHYAKPASAHFWVLPIYTSHAVTKCEPVIDDMSVWDYMESFSYSKEKEHISKCFVWLKEELQHDES